MNKNQADIYVTYTFTRKVSFWLFVCRKALKSPNFKCISFVAYPFLRVHLPLMLAGCLKKKSI